jgi:hypothetical protein
MKLPELEIGDIALVGKFKNRKATIEGFGKDKNNQPTILTNLGEFPVFKIRLQKLMASLKLGESAVVADRKSDWMKSFQEAVVSTDKKHQGKIDWDTATFLFNQNMNPKKAAEKYLEGGTKPKEHRF